MNLFIVSDEGNFIFSTAMGQKCTEQVILSLKDLYLNESDPSLNQETHFHVPRLVGENKSSISESPDWIALQLALDSARFEFTLKMRLNRI